MAGSDDKTLPVPPPRPGPSGGETFGGYQIGRELGRGGMGVVYCAVQASLKRTVALKMLTGRFGPEELARFLVEAETSAALQHSNIVHIYEVGEREGVPFFAMEFVDGGSLADRIARGVLPPREAATMIMTVARAVHVAHEHGVVHRDLKPGNVLLDRDGTPKVADFGIAKRLGDDAMLTSTGAIMGTPCYMAPEQASGSSRRAGPSADIYSLGAMLYELLTGRPPFLPHESDQPITLRVLNEEPVSPAFHRPEIPRDIEAICMMCLQKDPRDRFASAQSLADDLQRYLNDEPILAKPPTRIRRTVKWVKHHPWRAIAWALSFMLCGAGLLRFWQWDQYQRPRIEYACAVDMRFGGIEPVGALSESQSRRNGICLRLTRRGRHGPFVKAEVVNPRGRPAMVRDLLNYDFLPSWLQGAMGFESASARGRESVDMAVSHDGDEAVEITAHDRNGRVTMRIHYDRALETNAARSVRARFLNMRSYDYAMPSGASHAEFQRDVQGRDVRVTFFNSAGKPARNGEGVFGYEMKRNAAGRVERVVNTDENGGPMPNLRGVTQVHLRWNDRGQLIHSRFTDAGGHPAMFNGIAAAEIGYDGAGNVAVIRRLDADGSLKDAPDGDFNDFGAWAVKEFTRNDSGEITAISIRAADTGAEQPSVKRIELAYDSNGYPSDLVLLTPGGKQSSRLLYRRDERGNVIEYKELDADGDITEWNRRELDEWGNATLTEELDEDGQVEERTRSTFKDDRLVRETYEYANHQPREVGSGYTMLECAYHENGHRIEELYSGFKNKSLALRIIFDELGRRQHEVWIDEKERPVAGIQGWTWRKLAYLADSPVLVSEKYEDAAGKPARHPEGWCACRFEYNGGILTERIYEGFDGTQGYAMKRQHVNPRGDPDEERYFDAAGNKAWCPDGFHHIRFLSYNSDGLPASVISEDFDPGRFKHFRTRAATSWKDGKVARIVINYEDRGGSPAPGPDGSTGTEKEFDENGTMRRLILTGFDQTRVGYAGIEVAFTPEGKPEAVRHARADGTPVKNARATILFIATGAQEKAAELRPGDILLSSNGEPLNNTYEFVYGGPFPGGFIEVERDGRRIRVEGFKAGKIGIVLGDRAAP